MHGVRLTIAYDGTSFSGWSKQPGERTVQGTIEKAIGSMAGAPADVRGTSRTDAGVHALGQIAAFDSVQAIPPRGWRRGLNSLLPDDLVIVDADECAPGYNPRFDTTEKTYRYLMLTGETRDPLLRDRAWHLGPRLARKRRGGVRGAAIEDWLDVPAMREAATHLLGTHDFCAFRAADDGRENTIRTMREIAIHEGFATDPRIVAIEVRGDAFMKNMVRIIVGTLLDVGRERRAPDSIPALLGPGANRENAGRTAPARGLTLVSIRLGRSLLAPRA